jgi:hypothetical protein
MLQPCAHKNPRGTTHKAGVDAIPIPASPNPAGWRRPLGLRSSPVDECVIPPPIMRARPGAVASRRADLRRSAPACQIMVAASSADPLCRSAASSLRGGCSYRPAVPPSGINLQPASALWFVCIHPCILTDARPFPFLGTLNQATPHEIPGEVFYRLQVFLHRSQRTIEAAGRHGQRLPDRGFLSMGKAHGQSQDD